MRTGPFADEAGFRNWLATQERGRDPYFYAIRDRRDDRVGGLCALARSDPQNGVTEIGFILIAPVLQRTPAVTEAISTLIGWAFAHGYRRAEWKCDALNAASMAAARRYGFTYEGRFRQHMVYKGRNRDTAWWSIIDSEWPRISAAHRAWLEPANFDAAGQQNRPLAGFLLQGCPISEDWPPAAPGPDG